MRYLLVTHVPPFPADSGGRQRTRVILDALKQRGNVDILLLSNAYNADAVSFSADKHETSEFAPRWCFQEPRIQSTAAYRLTRRLIGHRIAHALAYHIDGGKRFLEPNSALKDQVYANVPVAEYDLVIARYLRSVTACGLISRDNVVLDLDDYMPTLLRSRIPQCDVLTRATLKRYLRISEQRIPDLVNQCLQVWISNSNDARIECLKDSILIRNVAYSSFDDLPPYVAPQSHRPVVLAVGTWTYSANRDGIHQFVTHVWPTVLTHVPAAELRIIGKGTEGLPKAVALAPNVRIIGFADDLAPHYHDASFFIAPVLFGGGTNIKVLEGAFYGRTGVITRQAYRGYDDTFSSNPPFQIAEALRSMATPCITLLQNPQFAIDQGLRAREIYRHSYSISSVQRSIHAALDLAHARVSPE